MKLKSNMVAFDKVNIRLFNRFVVLHSDDFGVIRCLDRAEEQDLYSAMKSSQYIVELFIKLLKMKNVEHFTIHNAIKNMVKVVYRIQTKYVCIDPGTWMLMMERNEY